VGLIKRRAKGGAHQEERRAGFFFWGGSPYTYVDRIVILFEGCTHQGSTAELCMR